jgi:hypothetical protein
MFTGFIQMPWQPNRPPLGYLLLEENEEFSHQGTDPEERAYTLKAAVAGQEIPFGFLYLSATGYTLGWPGALDFHQLQHEVLQTLSKCVEPGRGVGPNVLAETTVSLILGGASAQIVKCRLQEPEERVLYEALLSAPSRIEFVRYDVGDEVSPQRYTLTAENASPHTEFGELCVARPRSRPVTPALVNWIVEHHAQNTRFAGSLDGSVAAMTLERVINPAQQVAASSQFAA